MSENLQQPQHTTVIATDFEPRIIVQEDDGRWFRVLNWFYDEIVPDLTGSTLKLMLGMLRHRDNTTGLVARSRQAFADELRLSKGGLSAAFTALTTHPAGLLAIRGSSLFEPLPGRQFAGRPIVPAVPPPAQTGSLQRTGVHSSEPEFTPANREFTPANQVSIERARARPPRLVKAETQNQTAPDAVVADPVGWSGPRPVPPAPSVRRWPELSLWGQMAEQRGDVRGVLEDLGIRPPTLDVVAAAPGLSIARILVVAALVAEDPEARSKPACLAGRLLGRKLPTGIEARGGGRLDRVEMAAVAELERLRQSRTTRHHHTSPRTPAQGD